MEDLPDQFRIQQIPVQIDKQRAQHSCGISQVRFKNSIKEARKREYKSISRNTCAIHP